MGRLIDITEASTLLGVNPKTLRRRDEEGRYENSEDNSTGTID
jgi:hypothetical protein